MFSPSLCASFIVLVASAVSASATPSLTVKVSTPDTRVNGLENLKVITTVTNTGDRTLKLLNHPRGVLSSFHADSFSITNATGSRPLFNGAMVWFSPTYATGLDDPSVFTVLYPGAHIDVQHDLSAAYNFTPSGPGDYLIKPSNRFIYVDADGTPRDLLATVEDTAKVTLSGNLAVSRIHDKRAFFSSCSSDQQTTIAATVSTAQSYVKDAYDYLAAHQSGTERYTTWFGGYTDARAYLVREHFWLMASHAFDTITYDCRICDTPGVGGFVYPDELGFIYLCPAFWSLPDTGGNSKAGLVVHEASHFHDNGGTLDYIYGQVGSATLAIIDPNQAVMNACNHQFFAENYPPQP